MRAICATKLSHAHHASSSSHSSTRSTRRRTPGGEDATLRCSSAAPLPLPRAPSFATCCGIASDAVAAAARRGRPCSVSTTFFASMPSRSRASSRRCRTAATSLSVASTRSPSCASSRSSALQKAFSSLAAALYSAGATLICCSDSSVRYVLQERHRVSKHARYGRALQHSFERQGVSAASQLRRLVWPLQKRVLGKYAAT